MTPMAETFGLQTGSAETNGSRDQTVHPIIIVINSEQSECGTAGRHVVLEALVCKHILKG